MDWTHLLTGGLAGIVHPVMGWLQARTTAKHEEALARINIDEVKAEAQAGVQVAAEATRGAAVKGELAGWLASYKLGDLSAFPKGVKVPSWAGGLIAIAAVMNAVIHPAILLGTFLGAAFIGTPVWTHALASTIGWSLGHHASVSAGLSAVSSNAGDALRAWGVTPDKINQMLADKGEKGTP